MSYLAPNIGKKTTVNSYYCYIVGKYSNEGSLQHIPKCHRFYRQS